MRIVKYVCLVVCLSAGTRIYGQLPSKTNLSDFKGRVVEGGFSAYTGLVVEVSNLQDRNIREHADVASDGSFSFRALPEGDYQVKVTNMYGDELTSTVTSIGPFVMGFEIRMPQSKLQKPVSGTVSIQQLNHPPSRQVRKLLESGQRLIHDQHYDDAAERLREATRDDPSCVQAHASLGLALAKMSAWDGAADAYRAAVTLDPGNSGLHSNLGAALAMLKRYDEAENEASTALRLDSRNDRAHYVMAGILSQRQGPLREVVAHLLAAQDTVPSAKAAVEKICASNHVEGCPNL
jgi:tetratricopeptide (TPR) repeat protein